MTPRGIEGTIISVRGFAPKGYKSRTDLVEVDSQKTEGDQIFFAVLGGRKLKYSCGVSRFRWGH